MKPAGFFLLLGGWAIVLAALALLPSGAVQIGFIVAGVAVELLGLVLAIRAHRILHDERG